MTESLMERRRSGLCMNCGQPGVHVDLSLLGDHGAYNCPTPETEEDASE